MIAHIDTNNLRRINSTHWEYADFTTTFPAFAKTADPDTTYLLAPTIEQINSVWWPGLEAYYKDWIVWKSPACHNLAHKAETKPRIFLYILEKP